MSYLDDRQTMLSILPNIDGLADRVKAISAEINLSDIKAAVGIAVHFNSAYLPLTSQDYWDPYTVEVQIRLPNETSKSNLIGILYAPELNALDVQKTSTDAQGLLAVLGGTIDSSYITTNTLFYVAVGTEALGITSDEVIDTVSIRIFDADKNTVPSSFYTIEEIGFSPTSTPLATPTGLNATQITSNSATISWNAVTNASSYQITYTPSGTILVPSDNYAPSVFFEDLVEGFDEDRDSMYDEMFEVARDNTATPMVRGDFSNCILSLLYEATVGNVDGDVTVTLRFATSSTDDLQEVFIFAYATDGTRTEIAPNQYQYNWDLLGICDVDDFQIADGFGSITFRIPEELAVGMSAATSSAIAIVTENIPEITNSALAEYSPATVDLEAVLPSTILSVSPTTVTSATNSVGITNLLNFTPYSVEVVAVGDGTTYSDSDPSSALTFTTLQKLATPTIDVSAEDDFGVAIQQIAGATTYHLQYRAQGTTAWTDITSSSNDIELPSNIPTGVVYEFRAYVSDSTGVALDSDFSDILTEKLFSTLKYKSLKSRTATSISFNVAYLVSGRYVSEYKPRSSSEWTIIGTQTLSAAPSGNNVVVASPSGLTPSTAYDFRVRLVRDDGESRWLNVAQVTRASVSAPPAPTCTVDGTTVYVQITPLEGYSWYQVVAYVNSPNETGAVRLPWTQATNQTVTELSANTYYIIRVQYRITAENDAYENDSFRSMTQVMTGVPRLETPTGLESSNITSTSARIGWNGVYGAVDYLLEYRVRGNDAWIVDGEQSGGTTQEEEEPLMSETATQLKAAIAEVGMAESFGSVLYDASDFNLSALFEISVSNVSYDTTFSINLDYPTGTSPGTDEEYVVFLMLVVDSNVENIMLDVINVVDDDTIRIDVAATEEQLAAVEGTQAMLAILIRDNNAEATNATITDVSPDSTEITIVR